MELIASGKGRGLYLKSYKMGMGLYLRSYDSGEKKNIDIKGPT